MTVAGRVSPMRRAAVRLRRWARRIHLYRKLAFALALVAVLAGIATVVPWTGVSEYGPDPDNVLYLLILDLVVLVLLGALIASQLVKVWRERRRGMAGSGLHVRIVMMFSLVAVTPAILVAVFSALFLDIGIQAWFSERVRTAVESSDAVAHAYLEEHRQGIRADAFAIANDLNREAPNLMRNPQMFDQLLANQADLRSLSEAVVVDGTGRVLARSPFSLTLELELVPWEVIEQAAKGQVVVLTDSRDDRARAAVKLRSFVDAYLLVGRFIEPGVLENIQQTGEAVSQFRHLEERREEIFVTFGMIFVVVALLLLLAAVWIGLTLATQISSPVSELISAAEEVRRGDLTVRVDPSRSVEEVGTLGRAFNRMTNQLQSQREGLMLANQDLDERRRFTETVLSGVSAGVIGLDGEGLINLPNRSASELLSTDLDAAVGLSLQRVVPEMRELLTDVMNRPERQGQSEIKIVRDGRPRTLIVRVAAEIAGDQATGYVVTFDDVTALVSAQRKAAWADVARRIAHEIKNPLTPIQLASERLKRKYLSEIKSDPETFTACTDTIVRQVEDIGRMVDEFSSFARMPQPELKHENLCKLVREAVFLERNRSPDVRFEVVLPDASVQLRCDSRQISQALTNILKNASEAISARESDKHRSNEPGHVTVSVEVQSPTSGPDAIRLTIEDNGKGLPEENRDRLTEPYVTSRAKGTGLGLAIVKKIMEDHNADLIIEDGESGGARVSMVFLPLREAANSETSTGPDAEVINVAPQFGTHG